MIAGGLTGTCLYLRAYVGWLVSGVSGLGTGVRHVGFRLAGIWAQLFELQKERILAYACGCMLCTVSQLLAWPRAVEPASQFWRFQLSIE